MGSNTGKFSWRMAFPWSEEFSVRKERASGLRLIEFDDRRE